MESLRKLYRIIIFVELLHRENSWAEFLCLLDDGLRRGGLPAEGFLERMEAEAGEGLLVKSAWLFFLVVLSLLRDGQNAVLGRIYELLVRV